MIEIEGFLSMVNKRLLIEKAFFKLSREKALYAYRSIKT